MFSFHTEYNNRNLTMTNNKSQLINTHTHTVLDYLIIGNILIGFLILTSQDGIFKFIEFIVYIFLKHKLTISDDA